MSQNGRTSSIWEIQSSGVVLRLAGPADLGTAWTRLAPSMLADTLSVVGGHEISPENASAVVVLPDLSDEDLRRWINALLHCEQLLQRVLTVHGVAMQRNDRCVVLLGEHGSGKTSAGLALAKIGWHALAADSLLLKVPDDGSAPRIIGGTSHWRIRDEARRWFTSIPAEITPLPAVASAEVSVACVAEVDVDGDPLLHRAEHHVFDTHTATTLWYRASGHMLDRVLDGDDTPLRWLESPQLIRTRLGLCRQIAGALPVSYRRGNPHQIAADLDRSALEGLSS